MIKINLLAERKAAKAKASSGLKIEGAAGGQNLLLVGIVLVGVLVAAGWSWKRHSDLVDRRETKIRNEQELARLAEIRKKADEYKQLIAAFDKKINLITELKKKQAVPVHILDQVSRNLPDFLWLDSMSSGQNQINIVGKATTYNAVSNFYDALQGSGHFADVVLGKTAEVPEGVSFSLGCRYQAPQEPAAAAAPASAPSGAAPAVPQPPQG